MRNRQSIRTGTTTWEFLAAEYLRVYIRMPYGSHPVDVYQQGHYGYYNAGANLHAVQPVVKVSTDTDKNNREQHGCVHKRRPIQSMPYKGIFYLGG